MSTPIADMAHKITTIIFMTVAWATVVFVAVGIYYDNGIVAGITALVLFGGGMLFATFMAGAHHG